MKIYELIKYLYGIKPRYTAFCLTPKTEPKQIKLPNGTIITYTNKGISSYEARHFQTPEYAQEWARLSGIQISLAHARNWLPTSGSGIWRRGSENKYATRQRLS
jgi:hypothetical protein